MKRISALGAVAVLVLAGCSEGPEPPFDKAGIQELVEEGAAKTLSGPQGLLVNDTDPWLGAVASKRIHGAPLPRRIRNENVKFRGFRSSSLTGVEIIEAITRDLGLSYEIDTTSFYLISQELGRASEVLEESGVGTFGAPPTSVGSADADGGDTGGSSGESGESSVETSEACQGSPYRVAARNEGLVEFARSSNIGGIQKFLADGTSISPGEVALNNLLIGGLERDILIEGTPKEAFNQIVKEFNLGGWEYAPLNDDTGKVIFRYYVTRGYKVALRPPFEGVAGESATPVAEDRWSELRTRLARRVGADAEVYTYCNSQTVEVRAKPERMNSVQNWLNAFSRHATETVHIEFDIYEVVSSAADGFAVDFNILRTNPGGNLPFVEILNGGSRVPLDITADYGKYNDYLLNPGAFGGNTGQDIPDLPEFGAPGVGGGRRGISGLVLGKDVSGTFLVDLLATAGDTTLQYSKATTMFSGHSKRIDFNTVTNVDVNEDTTVVAVGDSAETNTSVQTEDLETGILLDVQASILQDGQVLISYVLEIVSGLPGPGGTSTINFVNSTSKVADEFVMQAGEQLVQSTSQISRKQRNKEGVGDPSFVLLGGEDTRSETLTTFVVVVRPSIIRPTF